MTASVDDWTAAQLLGGKSASDLQENIVVDNVNRTISGTLHYVTGYTQFSGLTEEQSGNYLVAKIEATGGATIYVKKTADDTWTQLDDDGLIIFRITDLTTQKVFVKAVRDGQDNFFTYDLSGLTLEASS